MTAVKITFDIVVFAAGYAASIYSWTWIKTQYLGAAAVAASLRTKATALESAVTAVTKAL